MLVDQYLIIEEPDERINMPVLVREPTRVAHILETTVSMLNICNSDFNYQVD